MKISELLCLDHFYIMLAPEQFNELAKLQKTIAGFKHSVVKTKAESWEGCYWRTNSGDYIEFMLPVVGKHEGMGVAFSARSPIYADVRDLKKDFKKLPWLTGTRVWPDKSKWFTWLALKSKKSKKSNMMLGSFINIWAMFYHPRYFQYKNLTVRPTPNALDRIIQLDVFMNPQLKDFLLYHLQWTPAVTTTTKTKMTVIVPNRELAPFHINIVFKESCKDVTFRKIVCETHKMKKIKLPKGKTIGFTQKQGVLTITNKLI